MRNLHLVFPTIIHKEMWHDIIAEFENSNEKIIPYALKLGCENYDEFLQKTFDFANNQIPSELSHLVQATTYFLMDEDEDRILGAVNIRHYLNDYLLQVGGNIGYGVRRSERQKGYAANAVYGS